VYTNKGILWAGLTIKLFYAFYNHFILLENYFSSYFFPANQRNYSVTASY